RLVLLLRERRRGGEQEGEDGRNKLHRGTPVEVPICHCERGEAISRQTWARVARIEARSAAIRGPVVPLRNYAAFAAASCSAESLASSSPTLVTAGRSVTRFT